MKRSSALILAVLIALAGIAIYVYRSKSHTSTTAGDDSRNFAFKDTAAITKIFIADKEGNASTVVRTKEGWLVNDKFHCRGDAILNLLETIKQVEVKSPVPQSARATVLRIMSSDALKVEIYAGDELVRQYYVGHETLDSEGSHMLLTNIETGKNYPEPYVCFIPGFIGFLQPRFIAKENEWRDRLVINYIPPQLREVKVQHSELPADSSFAIELQSTSSFKLRNAKGAELPFDEAKMKQYLAYFQNISYEALITGANKKLQDSLSAKAPFTTISITSTDLKTETYKFYRKFYSGRLNPEHGVNYTYDPDRLFMRFANDREWALAQYFTFGKLFVSSSYFAASPSVKK